MTKLLLIMKHESKNVNIYILRLFRYLTLTCSKTKPNNDFNNIAFSICLYKFEVRTVFTYYLKETRLFKNGNEYNTRPKHDA